MPIPESSTTIVMPRPRWWRDRLAWTVTPPGVYFKALLIRLHDLPHPRGVGPDGLQGSLIAGRAMSMVKVRPLAWARSIQSSRRSLSKRVNQGVGLDAQGGVFQAGELGDVAQVGVQLGGAVALSGRARGFRRCL